MHAITIKGVLVRDEVLSLGGGQLALQNNSLPWE